MFTDIRYHNYKFVVIFKHKISRLIFKNIVIIPYILQCGVYFQLKLSKIMVPSVFVVYSHIVLAKPVIVLNVTRHSREHTLTRDSYVRLGYITLTINRFNSVTLPPAARQLFTKQLYRVANSNW